MLILPHGSIYFLLSLCQRCHRNMRPTQRIKVQKNSLAVLKLQLQSAVCLPDCLDPENRIHLRGLGVGTASATLQKCNI